jgi:hypothetical protein
VPYERDPLSVRYDAMAGRLLGQAIARRGSWVYQEVARPVPGPRTVAWLRSHGIRLDALDSGGLTSYERAFERAVWWNAKRLGISVTFQQNPRWSLQREWGPVSARGRLLGIRLSDPKTARLAVQRKPRSEQWHRNRALQSGGVGSPKQRFG